MYLSFLNEEEQKDFLELARYSMGLNGEYKDSEEKVLLNYKYECHLEDYLASRQDQIEAIIEAFTKSTDKVKKIVLIELYGVLSADNEVCEKESKFFGELAAKLDVDGFMLKRIIRWVEAMNDLVEEGLNLIG
ncbi:hypothetical protein [Thiomicrorhabdus cannonii]|uniref:hypothetical protein n=1 Tax=Thiomicrorhabdus cannonii TaxID=2748011 RepID=UPI0015BB0AAB|nr:hypothetical protein [Thiomicrorhabdus cannonii]